MKAIIVCTNADDKFPVVAKIQGWDAPFVELFNRDGIHSLNWDGCIFDLFFADEEEELTEFEEMLASTISAWQISMKDSFGEGNYQLLKKDSKELLDIARKQIEKEITKEVEQKSINHTYAYQNGYENGKYDTLKNLPKFKKIPQGTSRKDLFDMMHKHIVLAFNDCVDYYYLDESDLRKLTKEE